MASYYIVPYGSNSTNAQDIIDAGYEFDYYDANFNYLGKKIINPNSDIVSNSGFTEFNSNNDSLFVVGWSTGFQPTVKKIYPSALNANVVQQNQYLGLETGNANVITTADSNTSSSLPANWKSKLIIPPGFTITNGAPQNTYTSSNNNYTGGTSNASPTILNNLLNVVKSSATGLSTNSKILIIVLIAVILLILWFVFF